MQHLIPLSRTGITPEITRPDPARVLAGDPVHTTWNVEERPQAETPGETPHGSARGTLYAGLWHTTQGEWRVDYQEWEYVHILEGHSVLIDEAGRETHLRAGDSHVIRPGFKGSWRCLQPTLKDYVILA